MKVMKFGGTSVANAENIKKIIAIAKTSLQSDDQAVVVVSALSGVTDGLIDLATKAANGDASYKIAFKTLCDQHTQVINALIAPDRKATVTELVNAKYHELETMLSGLFLIKEASPRSLDYVTSFGEQLSSYIISEIIISQGLPAQFIDARQIIKTDSNFGSANVDINLSYAAIANAIGTAKSPLYVMGGFIGSTEDGVTTTLGRGGSDYTASLVGAGVNADVVEIWTDVDGILTADPRKVPKAFPLKEILYEEAAELAHFGAKVIHPKTMRPARLKNIPITIKNTFNPSAPGTKISNTATTHDYYIKGITVLNNISLLRIQSSNGKNISVIVARLFDLLHHADIDVLLTTQASHEQAVSIAVQSAQTEQACRIIEKAFELELQSEQVSPLAIESDVSIVAIVGKQMKGIPGIAGRFFSTLGKQKINIVAIAQGSSELNVSAVIKASDETKALRCIHQNFFNDPMSPLHIFLVGTGLIGSTVLKQAQSLSAMIQFCGLADHETMLVQPVGIALDDWKKQLDAGQPTNLSSFVQEMMNLNLPDSVFVDCTASEEIVELYEGILTAGIAIVTPNKKANSGVYQRFKKLHELSRLHQTPFLYETNVGAGLPVIHAAQSLVASGDTIVKIEAILSGSLSYIFNTFGTSDRPFSDIVAEAKTQGYTEPDPRDDLSGKDVARKIIILAREMGVPLELTDVKIEPLLPAACLQAVSVEDFFTELKKCDPEFITKKHTAENNQTVLRFIATLQNGQAKISLQAVGANHPFYNMSGSDNIIAFTTDRYCNTPLVIKGPGAGAEVTAGGVLADIVSIYESKAYAQQ